MNLSQAFFEQINKLLETKQEAETAGAESVTTFAEATDDAATKVGDAGVAIKEGADAVKIGLEGAGADVIKSGTLLGGQLTGFSTSVGVAASAATNFADKVNGLVIKSPSSNNESESTGTEPSTTLGAPVGGAQRMGAYSIMPILIR